MLSYRFGQWAHPVADSDRHGHAEIASTNSRDHLAVARRNGGPPSARPGEASLPGSGGCSGCRAKGPLDFGWAGIVLP